MAERLGESLQGRHEMGGREYLVYGIARASYAGRQVLPAPKPQGFEARLST